MGSDWEMTRRRNRRIRGCGERQVRILKRSVFVLARVFEK